MLQSPSIVVPSKQIWTPSRERRVPRHGSFITGQPTQHRDWNLYLAGTGGSAPQPDPFYPAVLYLFNGDIQGGNLVDVSQYAGEYSNPLNKFSSAVDSPFGDGSLSLRRDIANGSTGPTAIVSGGPTGAVTVDGDTFTVEWWFKLSALAGDIGGVWLRQANLEAVGNQINVVQSRDVVPIIYRLQAFSDPAVMPGIVGATSEITFLPAPPPNWPYATWIFFAVVCSAGNLSSYMGLAPGGSAARLANVNNPGAGSGAFLSVGSLLAGASNPAAVGEYFAITQLRYTNGIARGDPNSGTYPIPDGPFPTFGP